jgi:hypothetical protein
MMKVHSKMQDSYPDTDSDESGIDIEALEREIERSLNAGLESKYTVAIKQFRELSKQRCELKKNKSSDAVVVKAKRDVKQQRKAAREHFIQLAKEYEKDAQEFINWAINKNSSLALVRSWNSKKKQRLDLFVCCLMTCATTMGEAMVFADIGGKFNKKTLQKIHSLIETWYLSDSTQPIENPAEVHQNTIETADQEFAGMNITSEGIVNPVEHPMPTEIPMDNTIKCRLCGGDHWTLSCPTPKKPAFDKKKLPSLKQAMADVDSASNILYSAKYILQLVICQQDDELQTAKAMMKSLE